MLCIVGSYCLYNTRSAPINKPVCYKLRCLSLAHVAYLTVATNYPRAQKKKKNINIFSDQNGSVWCSNQF